MEYWVDLHENDAEAFEKHLRKYALRKNIQIQDISNVIKSFSIQTLVGVEAEPEGHFFRQL
jgi:folate-binding Fe-S cluster repair protein YgfZ